MTDIRSDQSFTAIEQTVTDRGVGAALEQLVQVLRDQASYYELFEALKMQVRHQLGLPIVYDDSGDDLDPPLRDQLEEGLLGACREVGLSLLSGGQVREGWAYLRPVGNREEVAEALQQIEPDEENLDALVEVAFHEGIDTTWGFQLLLDQYGTCNAITSLESLYGQMPPADRRAAVGLLVEHLHRELLASVQTDLERRGTSFQSTGRLEPLVVAHPELFGEHAYHIDTTHLASTVRLARAVEDREPLELAVDLTEYGRRLNEPFQYAGEEPFADLYPSHGLYFRAILGSDRETAIDYFRRKADQLSADQHGTQPIETLIELLDRLGQPEEAIDTLLDFVAKNPEHNGQVLPLLLNLSEKAGDYGRLMEFCRAQNDLLGFATGAMRSSQDSMAGKK